MKKISPIQIVRAVIQLIAFVTVPALFITIFSSIGGLITSIAGGSFVFSDNIGRIILISGVFLITLVWGRFFCGFICSFGAMQDLLNSIGKLIPFKIKVPEKADKWLKLLKYAVLAFVAVGVWGFSVTDDTVWSPWAVFGIYSYFSGWSSLKYFLTLGGVLLLLIIIGSLFIERFFCRYLCPLGALFSLVSRFRIYSLNRKPEKCGNCKLCTEKCSMGIPLYKYDEVRSGECINCMKCTSVCPNENISADTLPAISGTVAVTAVAGLYYAGVLTAVPDTAEENKVQVQNIAEAETNGIYTDGTYKGSGNGFRGKTEVTVTVESGVITDITVDSYKDDKEFFQKAKSGVIADIIKSQSTDVDAVSGATFSSNGIIEAVKNALGEEISEVTETATEQSRKQKKHSEATTEAVAPKAETTTESATSDDNNIASDTAGQYADGVYTGTGNGFRGATNVTVTVENGEITEITVNSYSDDDKFFSRAESGVITSIIKSQSTDVDAVSGATFSSNGIKEAVADALGIEFTNPNSTQQRGHGGRHSH
ncbi:FMN-binding protein [Ruminococcus flavefaciens]|uniref:Polyferredoxin n=1 Tax=Ruminococcus flavefaciens TaxID=1265 RepID=A0A1M7GNW7_RUMFL|nr:FMN-binding protein [Ruminococcus flavefaciens]SHM17950.1 Polyferredoxin [Ruminococcus flavefaciens]